MSAFLEAAPLRRAAHRLLEGCGYGVQRRQDQLRADDQLVRARACAFLTAARRAVVEAETAYRREHLSAPTRAQPFPRPERVATAQLLERLARDIGALEGQVRSQPMPGGDGGASALRGSGAMLLDRLRDCDELLIGQCDLLHTMIDGRSGADLQAQDETLREGLQAIADTLRRRATILL
jgi:hypothetical protein